MADHDGHLLSCGPSLVCVRASRDPAAGCKPPETKPCIAAYLGHWTAADGAAALFLQKAAVDGFAEALGSSPVAYYVDSGRPDGPAAYGHALARLVQDARDGGFDAVIVRHLSVFAEDYAMALRAAIALQAEVALHEASGGRVLVDGDVAALIGRFA